MAKLFKERKLKEIVENYEIPDFDSKLDIVRKWYEASQSKKLSKKTESEVEQAFNQSFFVDILGYKTFPEEPYTIEPKGKTQTSGGQKPDAILGVFEEGVTVKRVAAVCEIKDANTSLDKSQRREGSLTPVQQGFKYKTQYEQCDFVIVSNFEEIRLLQDTEIHYEEWTLKSLVDPTDDYYQFKKFYYLLCAENLVSKRGKSKTQVLLAEVVSEQESITKAFYKDYKSLRGKLIKNIFKNNEEAKKRSKFYELAVEKAQKIIDRLVFVAFCEDLGLLPENILKQVIESDNQTFGSTWDTLKGFFNAVDVGSVKLGNEGGYNGELFKPDPDLDALKIDDEICREFLDIGSYDFSEDLTVNILGHIFEQSISDLEELKAIGDGEDLDKNSSKRKKDGIFYTPEYIVDYIVQNSVGKWLEDRKLEIFKKHKVKEDLIDENYDKRLKEAYFEYQGVLQSIKVLDPACGSGAFLVKVFDYLLSENERVNEVLGGNLLGAEAYVKSILQNNIYGVDLNSESVEITKLSLWLKTAKKGEKLARLDGNIKCGNSLIDDPEVVGKKAFDWGVEFKSIMDQGGFDVVVGNPPYVRQELLGPYKPYFSREYDCFSSTTDLFAYFYEKAIKVTSSNGYIAYISNSFSKTTGAGKVLRSYIQNNVKIEQVLDFGVVQVFQGATTYPVIFIFRKTKPSGSMKYLSVSASDLDSLVGAFNDKAFEVDQSELDADSWVFESSQVKRLRSKILSNKTVNELYGRCYRGILTGLNEAFIIDKQIRLDLIEEDPDSELIIKPLWEGKDMSKWVSHNNDKYLIFTRRGIDISKYPAIERYLGQYRSRLEPKKSTDQKIGRKAGPYKWYEIQDVVGYYECFEKNKIVWPNLQSESKFCFDDTGRYINAPSVILPTDDLYLVGILNSSVVWFFLKGICVVRSGGYIEVKPQYFSQIPIPNIGKEDALILSGKVNTVIGFVKDLGSKKESFKDLLDVEFENLNWTRKLDSWWELSFDEFVKALKIGKISLSSKDELLSVFNKYKVEIEDLFGRIDLIEKEIDNVVYDLYELTEDERKIVLLDVSK